MSNFKEIDVKEFKCDPFEKIGEDWMLITAQKDDKVNTMTASWGAMGIMWHHKVVMLFIKGARYTKEFLDQSDTFSVTFYDTKKYRKDLTYLGTVSGRDEDKIEKVGFTIEKKDGTPYFAEAKTVLICKKLSRHFLDPKGIFDESVVPTWYQDGNGFHDMYIGEIVKVMEAE